MPAPRKVLFVCTGNICRSAMAEHLLRKRAADLGLDLEAASCGTAGDPRYQVPGVVRRLLAAEGVPPFEHRSRLAVRETLRWADLILTMTAAHQDHLLDLYPEFSRRTRLFREAAGLDERDVADPMGRPDEAFVLCLAEIRAGLENLLAPGGLLAPRAPSAGRD
ncbi:MAG: low molecular weight protein arginine phosphatase [Elusimicrobia bacterium]|nr:low molecular weight protein arginine phosphatase [Elusimicrobiota bacterium]